MGAKQSSEGGARAASSVEPPRASYYELLSVERTATEDEIKKAYRRKALELHPDRNFGREEEATKLFAEIQVAYEVLSDAQERAWYDSHENAILSGADTEDIYEHNVRVTTAEDITLMLSRFHGKVDYSDAATGFFGFLRETFEQLAKEENLAADWDGLEPRDYPSFGHKDDDYEDVVRPFYNVWSGFSTQKSFAWKDKFKLSEAPDRRYRRAMEKENKKFRDDAIKEFNSAVQVLVAFVRKRDPRYLPNTQTDDDRQKALRDASKDQAARARAANAAKIATQAVPQWAQTKEQSDPEQSDEWDEDEAQEEFECVACNKTFKSERQFEAHEKSKKHQKAVQAVRRQMEKDNKKLGLNAKKNLEDSEYSLLSDEGDMSDGEDLGDVDLSEVTQSFDAVDIKSATDSPSEVGSDEQDHVAEDKSSAPEAPAVTKEHDTDNGTENEEIVETSDAEEVPKASAAPPASADDPQSEDEGPKKLGKAAQKRAKKAAKQAAVDEEGLKHKCAQCGAAFPSRTRLFQHITDFGHAAPVAKTKAQKNKGKK